MSCRHRDCSDRTRSTSLRAIRYKRHVEARPRRQAKKNQIGVRELRRNLSAYLRRVEAGETLEVVGRGKAVALLMPLPRSPSILDRLIAEGRATEPTGDLLELGLPAGRETPKLTSALEAVRKDRT